jgi:polyisoprenoid-binding protein YceI
MNPIVRFSFALATSVHLGLVLGLAACDDKPAPPQATVAPAMSTNSASASVGETTTYVIEPSTSKVAWTGAKITASHEGSFSQFKGTIAVARGRPESAKIHLDIDTRSLTTQPDKLMGHLKSADFFDVEGFPKAIFDSTSITTSITTGGASGANYTVTGNLSLHGVTKSVTFPAAVTVSPAKVSAKADFSISRKDWNLVYPGMPNDLIKDEVAIHLILEAPKQGS